VGVRVAVGVLVGVRVGPVGVALGVNVAVGKAYTNTLVVTRFPKVGWFNAVNPPATAAPTTDGLGPKTCVQLNGTP
jgi:hypothetical protein